MTLSIRLVGLLVLIGSRLPDIMTAATAAVASSRETVVFNNAATSIPAQSHGITVSREVIVRAGLTPEQLPQIVATSREAVLFNAPPSPRSEPLASGVSREVIVFNRVEVESSLPTTAVSREVTLYRSSGEFPGSISREVALFNNRVSQGPSRPPRIASSPSSLLAALGTTVEFRVTVTADSTGPVRYYWRKNGNLLAVPSEPVLRIDPVTVADGGSYTVSVCNLAGIQESSPFLLILEIQPLPFANSFTNRGLIQGISGTGQTNNLEANGPEANEPPHAGKRGGKSLWIDWLAPATGVATIATRGSTFDTLLGIYTGDLNSGLREIASDEDHGGFLTSQVRFNAEAGTIYHIAVDGYLGATGDLVLEWQLDANAPAIPVIRLPPISQVVRPGGTATFSVEVESAAVTYQWLRNDQVLPGATLRTLSITNVQSAQVGNYRVRVENSAGGMTLSPAAALEIGRLDSALSYDKLGDLQEALRRAGPNGFGLQDLPPLIFVSVVLGQLPGHTFDNFNSTAEPGEASTCGVLSDKSQWIAVRAEADGILTIDTSGSSIDTVLAVFRASDVFAESPIACDDNGFEDGKSSRVQFNAKGGEAFYVRVDGASGAGGTIELHPHLTIGALPERARFARWGIEIEKGFRFRVEEGKKGQFVLENSTDLKNWTRIVSTNWDGAGPFEWFDSQFRNKSQQFFRSSTTP